jgi:hypothetical protein
MGTTNTVSYFISHAVKYLGEIDTPLIYFDITDLLLQIVPWISDIDRPLIEVF